MRVVRVWICSLLMAGVAHSIGVPPLSIKRLVRDAEVVVVADVISEERETTTVRFRDHDLLGRAYKSSATTLRVLKGDAPAQLSVEFSVPQTDVGYDTIPNGTRVLFLNKDTEKGWVPASPYYPSLPALRIPPSSKTSASAEQAVVSEVGAVLISNAPTTEKVEAFGAGSHVESFEPYLKQALNTSADSDFRLLITASLIGRGDISQIHILPKLLSDPKLNPTAKSNFLAAVASGVRNPAALPQITQLLNSPDEEVRRAAVKALPHIPSPSAKRLLKASLNDSDEQVQLFAIRGLAKVYGRPGVTLELNEFRTHRDQYVNQWPKVD